MVKLSAPLRMMRRCFGKSGGCSNPPRREEGPWPLRLVRKPATKKKSATTVTGKQPRAVAKKSQASKQEPTTQLQKKKKIIATVGLCKEYELAVAKLTTPKKVEAFAKKLSAECIGAKVAPVRTEPGWAKRSEKAGVAAERKKLPPAAEGKLPKEYELIVDKLDTPEKIQAFLDGMTYDTGSLDCSARQAFDQGKLNCLSGANLAAYCLDRHGYGAKVLGLNADWSIDCGHQLAVYKQNGFWGAISKTTGLAMDTGLRGRDPVYATPRELAMSYFEFHVNKKGQKSLRYYSDPINPDKVDPDREWAFRNDVASGAQKLAKASNEAPHRFLPKHFRTAGLARLRDTNQ